MIELRLLGTLQISGPDPERVRPLLSQPRRAALLAYLAVRAPAGPERRDRLVQTFWPDAEPSSGRQSLRQALAFLRRTLGEQALVARGEARGEEEVGVDPAVVRCDVVELEALLDGGHLRRAADLHRGELLPGLAPTGIPAFERWLDETRDRLRLRMRGALRALADEDAAAGLGPLAVVWARRELALDPTDEDSAIHVMRRLVAVGDRDGALDVHAEIARLLARELDDEPSPELDALADRIRSMPARAADPAAGTPPAPAVGVAGAPAADAPVADAPAPDAPDADAPRADAPEAAAPLPTPGQPPARASRWHTARRSAAAAGALLALAAGILGWRALGANASAGGGLAGNAAGPAGAVVVADFASPGDSTLGWAVAQGVKIDLARSAAVRVLGDDAVAATLRRMGRASASLTLPVAREVALRAGAAMVVDGSIAPLGAGYLLTVRLVTADSGRTVAGYQAAADSPGAVVAAIGSLARRLRGQAGESLRAIHATAPLEDVTTPSLDALRRYTEGFRALARDGDRSRFVAMMREAIALDSTFAVAHLWLAAELDNRGGKAGEVARLIERAHALRGRLPAHDQRWIEYFHAIAGPPAARDSGRAVAALLARARDPANRDRSNTLNNLGWTYHQRGLRAPAESLYRLAIAADTTYRYPFSNLIQLREERGDLAGAEALIPLFRHRFPNGYTGVLVASALRRGRGDLDGAEALVREALAAGADPFARAEYAASLAQLAATRGRLRDFDAETARAAAARRERGVATADLEAALDRASAHALLGDRAGARRLLDSAAVDRAAAALDPLDRPHAVAAIAYALAGDAAAARRQLAGVERQIPEADLGRAYLLRLARASVALAERRWDDAVREARLARVGRCTRCGELALALAYDSAGAPDSAIAVYERTRVGVPMRRQVGAFSEVAAGPVLRRLGELYEARGDTARAVERYARFVALWRRADPLLRPQVAAVAARLDRLAARPAPAAVATSPRPGPASQPAR